MSRHVPRLDRARTKPDWFSAEFVDAVKCHDLILQDYISNCSVFEWHVSLVVPSGIITLGHDKVRLFLSTLHQLTVSSTLSSANSSYVVIASALFLLLLYLL